MGVRKTTDFLEKTTWILAGSLLFLSILGTAFIPREQIIQDQSKVRDQIETAIDPTQVPSFPTTAPEPDAEGNAPAEGNEAVPESDGQQ
jgi:preprotein translocase subunit SecG